VAPTGDATKIEARDTEVPSGHREGRGICGAAVPEVPEGASWGTVYSRGTYARCSWNMLTGRAPTPSEAGREARHQLGRVLLALALLDTGVLIAVVLLAVARDLFGLTTAEFLSMVLGAVGTVLAVRVGLAVRLKRRSGSLS